MNTIGDKQNEMYFYGYYKVFEYNHDFLNVFLKLMTTMTSTPM